MSVTYYWSSGCGRVELTFTSLDQAQSCAQPGRDAGDDVAALRTDEAIEKQLQALDHDRVNDTLREYGAWSDEERSDHDANLTRLLWIACGDVSENPDDYAEEYEA